MSDAALARVRRGLRLVTVPFPHLAGLVAAAEVTLDERVPTMGIFASGRLVANPQFVARLKENELVFVLAHEMLHLALRTHDRARGADRLEFNFAHDYIINDMLRAELGMQHIPAGGLDMPGARTRSAESIVLEMRRNGQTQSRTRVWEGQATVTARQFGGRRAGDEGQRGEPGDVLDDARERELFPEDGERQTERARSMRELAGRAHALAEAMGRLRGMRGTSPGGAAQDVAAQRGHYRTPWTTALQRWMESVAPGERTFTRPSRRGADRADVVLPGRRREGWMLHVVLDTSGSMTEEIPRGLGAIADFCDATGVDQVRLVQCDATVTADELVRPDALATQAIAGYGGSDLAPALAHLAADAQVRAVIVLTDGEIEYPREPLPYDVLWVLPPEAGSAFAPAYGRVLRMERTGDRT